MLYPNTTVYGRHMSISLKHYDPLLKWKISQVGGLDNYIIPFIF